MHLIATGNVGNDAAALAASPMLATVIEALARSYDHVVIDAGSASDVAVERFAPLATQAVLVDRRSGAPATRADTRSPDDGRLRRRGGARGRRAGRRGVEFDQIEAENRARRRRVARTSDHSAAAP